MNDTTFQGDGKVAYVPVVVNAKQKPITNAMKIRAMTDEEMAEFLRVIRYDWSCPMRAKNGLRRCTEYKDDCNKCWLDWLRKEVDDDNNS